MNKITDSNFHEINGDARARLYRLNEKLGMGYWPGILRPEKMSTLRLVLSCTVIRFSTLSQKSCDINL